MSTQQKTKIQDADQKKKKIQLLKQKYLKKTKPQDNNQSAILQNQTSNIQLTISQSNPIIVQKQPINQVKNLPIPPKTNFLKTQSVQNQIPKQQIKQVIQKQIVPLTVQQTIKEIKQKKKLVHEQTKKQQVPVTQGIPKPPSRIPGRNPPPPIIKKSPPPPPIIPQKLMTNETQKLQNEGDHKVKSIPVVQKQQVSFLQVNTKPQKQDVTSFAPPSSESNEMIKTDKSSQNIPPPPPPFNKNMKQVLNKRMAPNKPRPPPPSRVIQKTVQPQQEQNQGTQPQQIKNLQPATINNNKPQSKVKSVQIDDEYNNSTTVKRQAYKQKRSQTSQSVDPLRFIGQWLGSPELTLKQLFPQLNQVIQFYCLNKHLTLQITSNTQGFTPLIGQFVQAFIINNTIKYTQDQKRVAQQICFSFFYSNATQFSDIFLILLIKIGQGYLLKYEQALEDKLQKYLSRLLLYKNLFLPQQINGFMNFCLQRNLVKQSNFLQFLMLSQTPQLLTLINNTQIVNLKYRLGVLSYCKVNLKNKNLMGLYLRLIASIQSELAANGFVQRILDHIKQIDIPQNLYQYTKQLKLKLIKDYQNKPQTQDKKTHNNTTNNQSINQPSNQGSGLFGYFGLGKAIDKIKTSTQKVMGAVQKPKKVEEQKKQQIKWDPIKKRYIINGQIPQDEGAPQNNQSLQQKPKVPPPPPLGGARKAPPPLNNKKPGPRVPANRYA